MSDGFSGDGFVYDAPGSGYVTMLVIEDGSIVSEADGDDDDANSYVTIDDVAAYATLCGASWSPASDLVAEQAIIRSMLFIESFEPRLYGERVSALQVFSWPRAYVPNALGTGYISSTAVPKAIKNAVCEGAIIELATPGSLFASSRTLYGATKRTRKKVGQLETETEYFEGAYGFQKAQFEKILAYLAPFVNRTGQYSVVRA